MKMNTQTIKTLAIMLAAAFVMTIVPDLAMADEDPIGEKLCDIVGWFQSDTGRAIATAAIVALGIMAFFGKVTWGLALMFFVGIFAIFGASEIISAVSDGEGCA